MLSNVTINLLGTQAYQRRVNLLDASKFGNVGLMKYSIEEAHRRSFPWFSDWRYVWRHPIPFTYPSIRSEVVESQRVHLAIEKVSIQEKLSYATIKKRASQFFEAIRAAYSKVWCRFLGYLMFKVFRRLMKTLLVDPSQMERVKQADQSGVPIVYLPLHLSHLDYQIITWVVWHWGIKFPHVAAGDNLNLSGFGWLLRWTGAFFIKRRLDPDDESTKDQLYRAVLKTYLITLLKNDLSVEFFLEGTRSRMGKALLPKNGLISNVLEGIESGEIKDVYMVPTSITYDNVIEGIFYNELMGVKKQKESFIGVLKGVWESFSRITPCGTVSVDFGEPMLLSEQLKKIKQWMTQVEMPQLDYAKNTNSYRELLPWQDHSISHRNLVRAVGYDITFTAQNQRPIMISSLLSTLFLCKYRNKSVRISEVLRDLKDLSHEVQNLGYEVLGFPENNNKLEDTIIETLSYLEGSINIVREKEGILLQINNEHKSYITLAYHKNAVLSVYALIAAAALVRQKPSPNGDGNNIKKQMRVLLSTLKYEILLCSPCGDVNDYLEKAIEFLAKEPAFDYSFYGNIIKPALITLHSTATHLRENPDKYNQDADNVFIRNYVCQMAKDPQLGYLEAANSESIYNALKALRVWGAVNEQHVQVLSDYLIRQVINQVQKFTEP